MFRWDATGVLAKIRVPVLVIGGELDIVTKPEASRAIAASTAARVVVVDDVNHMGFLERYDIYNNAISEFAGEVQSTVPAGSVRMAAAMNLSEGS
jgi:pimeloyl-ACP methyl ester carboxylesterase